MCTTLEKLEVLDRETGMMLDELTYEVRQLFPEDKIPVSLMTTIYLSAKLNYPLQLAAAMNEIPNPDLRNYVMNMARADICMLVYLTQLSKIVIILTITFGQDFMLFCKLRRYQTIRNINNRTAEDIEISGGFLKALAVAFSTALIQCIDISSFRLRTEIL
ncbi:hypothetical protein GQX74_009763 [Glossina fuscipes]|nr:hypothetical protein GQX74_009763 [Glossina fuscipes]